MRWALIAASLHFGKSLPACLATMYAAYQSGVFESCCPMRFSCSPWVAAPRRSGLARTFTEVNPVSEDSTRPRSRAVTSCSSHELPSGSLNVTFHVPGSDQLRERSDKVGTVVCRVEANRPRHQLLRFLLPEDAQPNFSSAQNHRDPRRFLYACYAP